MQQFDLTAYRWVLVGLDLAYLFLGFAAAKEDKYPASRHRVSRASKSFVGVHIVVGAAVIYGGAVIFVLDNQHVNLSHCSWLYRVIAIAAVLHCCTVPGMLSKVPGCRKITVSYYVGVTIINFCNAVRVLCSPSVAHLMLLWGLLSVFVYVRFFVFVFHVVSGGADFMVVYTMSMALAGYFATVANGLNSLSLLIIAAPVVIAPFMVVYSSWFHRHFDVLLHSAKLADDQVDQAVKSNSNASQGAKVSFFSAVCSCVHAALDPADMPHQPAFKIGWYKNLMTWFVANNVLGAPADDKIEFKSQCTPACVDSLYKATRLV